MQGKCLLRIVGGFERKRGFIGTRDGPVFDAMFNLGFYKR